MSAVRSRQRTPKNNGLRGKPPRPNQLRVSFRTSQHSAELDTRRCRRRGRVSYNLGTPVPGSGPGGRFAQPGQLEREIPQLGGIGGPAAKTGLAHSGESSLAYKQQETGVSSKKNQHVVLSYFETT